MRLTDDRITEMQHALEQRMMIGSVENGSAVPGTTNKTVVVQTADAEFPVMILDVSTKLYVQAVPSTFGDIAYAYQPWQQDEPHQFTIQVGDFRSEGAV